jgi:hypothetical protein
MNYMETARKIVCGILAVALAMTVAAVEGLLRHRPDWLERVASLAATLRSVGQNNIRANRQPGTPAQPDYDDLPDPGDLAIDLDQNRLLLAYNELWEFVQDLRSDGLALDDGFCERIEREWSVSTLLTYLRSADKSLQEHASRKIDAAANILSQGGAGE